MASALRRCCTRGPLQVRSRAAQALRAHTRTLCAPAPKPTGESERWWHGSFDPDEPSAYDNGTATGHQALVRCLGEGREGHDGLELGFPARLAFRCDSHRRAHRGPQPPLPSESALSSKRDVSILGRSA